MILTPTLACADPLHLADDLDQLMAGGAGMWHIDVMDGHYVPNLCLNFDQAAAVKRYAPHIPLDVHLMVDRPFEWLPQLERLKPAYAAFHVDATPFAIRLISQIRAMGIKPGVVLNPSQPVSCLEEVLPQVDYVLVMAVEPGFSGQPFMPSAYDKVAALNKWRREQGLSFRIMVDGGVDHVNGPKLAALGADMLVGGAFVCFGQPQGIEASAREFIVACESSLK